MSGFQKPTSDNELERRSLGLSDLPTLRDARGEPVIEPPTEVPDNEATPTSEKPLIGGVEPTQPAPAIEAPETLSFVAPLPHAIEAVDEEPIAAPVAPTRRSEPIIAELPLAADPAAAIAEAAISVAPTRHPITAIAPPDEAEPVAPDVDPAALRSMLDQAERMMAQLQTGIEEARDTTETPGRLATELQERLKVGAGMLTAFQSQIERVEAVIGEADQRAGAVAEFEAARASAIDAVAETRKAETTRVKKELAAALDAARTAIDERARRRDRPAVEVKQIIDQVEEHIAASLRRIDGHVEQRIPEVPSQESIDLRVERSVQNATGRFDRHAAQVRGELETQAKAAGELRGQIASHVERIDAAEIKADELSARVDETGRAMKTEVEEARALARRCLDVRSGLASEMRKVVSGMEDVAGRGERMRIDVEEQLDRFEQLRDQVTDSLSNLEAVVRRVDRVEGTVDRLERLADRLAPWENLLCSGEVTADGLPKPAAALVDSLQSGLGRDMDSLSQTMQEMAERMSGIGSSTKRTAERTTTSTKPAQTTEARPGGLDQPIPRRPEKSEVLSAIEADKRRAKTDAGSPNDDGDSPRLHLRRTGTT